MKLNKIFYLTFGLIFLILFIGSNKNKLANYDMNYFKLVNGGEFKMGDTFNANDSNEKVHKVTVDSYLLSKYEITNINIVEVFNWALSKNKIFIDGNSVYNTADNKNELLFMAGEYKNLMCDIGFSNGLFFVKNERDEYPVIYITWFGAASYCNFLTEYENEKKGYNMKKCYDFEKWECDFSADGYRLPTEAEWEFAARNRGEEIMYVWGNNNPEIDGKKYANIRGEEVRSNDKSLDWEIWDGYNDGYVYTSPVGSFEPNKLGLYDLNGNVWEWCNDWFDKYSEKDQINPKGASSGSKRVIRGGCWANDSYGYRVTFHLGNEPFNRDCYLGFRICKSYITK